MENIERERERVLKEDWKECHRLGRNTKIH